MAEEDIQEIQNEEPSVNETEARKFGWVPKEEFNGDEGVWRDADAFLQRGKEINGFLRKDLEKIQRADAQKAAEIAELRSTMEEFRKYHNETEDRVYKRALEELKQQKVEAIEQGDGAKVVEIDDQIEDIKEAKKKPVVDTPKKVDTSAEDKEYYNWVKENLWYRTDPELKALAEVVGETIGTSLTGKAFLDEVTRQVKEAVPEKFTNPNRNNTSVGNSSDGRQPASNRKGKTYANLPAEAKAACDKFVKQKLMTQEQYISEYDWE